jgi:hypothetical protein
MLIFENNTKNLRNIWIISGFFQKIKFFLQRLVSESTSRGIDFGQEFFGGSKKFSEVFRNNLLRSFGNISGV